MLGWSTVAQSFAEDYKQSPRGFSVGWVHSLRSSNNCWKRAGLEIICKSSKKGFINLNGKVDTASLTVDSLTDSEWMLQGSMIQNSSVNGYFCFIFLCVDVRVGGKRWANWCLQSFEYMTITNHKAWWNHPTTCLVFQALPYVLSILVTLFVNF